MVSTHNDRLVFIVGKNGLSAQQRIDFLDNLRAVANSPDITAFEEAVKEMEKSQWFMTNTKAKNYVQNKWLNIAKVLCRGLAMQEAL